MLDSNVAPVYLIDSIYHSVRSYFLDTGLLAILCNLFTAFRLHSQSWLGLVKQSVFLEKCHQRRERAHHSRVSLTSRRRTIGFDPFVARILLIAIFLC
jgi:hypothetical protein